LNHHVQTFDYCYLLPPIAFSVWDTLLTRFHNFTITTKSMKFTTKSVKITTKCPFFTTKHAKIKTKRLRCQFPIKNTHQATADGADQALFSWKHDDFTWIIMSKPLITAFGYHQKHLLFETPHFIGSIILLLQLNRWYLQLNRSKLQLNGHFLQLSMQKLQLNDCAANSSSKIPIQRQLMGPIKHFSLENMMISLESSCSDLWLLLLAAANSLFCLRHYERYAEELIKLVF